MEINFHVFLALESRKDNKSPRPCRFTPRNETRVTTKQAACKKETCSVHRRCVKRCNFYPCHESNQGPPFQSPVTEMTSEVAVR